VRENIGLDDAAAGAGSTDGVQIDPVLGGEALDER
jgi:hypothetical protein